MGTVNTVEAAGDHGRGIDSVPTVDPIVLDFFLASAQVVLEEGGWIHPGTRLVSDGSGLTVACAADVGEPLLRIPRSCFVPMGELRWADAEYLELTDGLAELHPAAMEILLSEVGMHNQRGALATIRREHPQLAADITPELTRAVRAFRPSFRTSDATPATVFWGNRCFRLPGTAGTGFVPTLLPLVDLLNHDHGASTGALDSEGFRVQVCPSPGSDHCCVDYGYDRDAIGMAVVYGFSDEHNPWAHSAPLTVHVAAVGDVTVTGRGRDAAGALRPVHAEHASSTLTLSRISFHRHQSLEDLFREVATATELSAKEIERVISAVAAANLDLLQQIADSVSTDSTSGSSLAATKTLVAAARVQMATIHAMLAS